MIYLPAIQTTELCDNTLQKYILDKYGYRHNLFTKKSVYYYPYFLISAYYGRVVKDITKEVEEDCYIFGDSGGFQNVTLQANLDPLEILKWQENNCSAGLILDQPPFERIEGSAQFGKCSMKTFNKSLNKTIENAKLALKNRSNPKFKLFGVIQGDDQKRREKWFNAMRDVEKECGEFDGWALSPKPSIDIKEIAQHMILLHNNKIDKPMHVLQVTGFETMAIVAYLSTKFKSYVTVDSSSFSIGRRYGSYCCPHDFKKLYDLGKRKQNTLKSLPCMCPVCSTLKWQDIVGEYEEGIKSVPGHLISMHNMYQTIKYAKFLNSIKNDKNIFLAFCKQEFGQKFINVVNYIDCSIKEGHAKGLRNHIIQSMNILDWGNKKDDTNRYKDWIKENYPEVPRELAIKLAAHNFSVKEEEVKLDGFY
ncbi:MAG: hypothetical protein Unbinned1693contig1002_16 [Prokaryotic dsDNA virus sp.]|nr:MAG: hypothetical protein Unbinned1693contig1002_16 [Prokaryotic dsDNA virus sp.]